MSEQPQPQTNSPRVSVGADGVNVTPPTDESVALEGRQGMLRLLGAERLYGLASMVRSRMITERLALKTQNGTLGTPTTEPQDQELADMQLNLGDQYNIQAPNNEAQPMAPAADSIAQQALKMLPWMGLAGLGAWQLASRPDPPPAPDPPAIEDTDTDTQYRLRLSSGDPSP